MARKILVIEDSKTSRREIVRLVQEQGFTVLEAENGRYGLEFMRSNPDICMIFCDLNMPEMNGIEFAGALRQENSFRSTPLIMMAREVTANAQKETAAFQVAAWLSKPGDFPEIQKLLARHCR